MICEGTKLSFKSRVQIEEVGIASCYYCFKTFKAKKIKEWADKGETAICPYCYIDSVVPGIFQKEILKQWYEASWGNPKTEEEVNEESIK